MVAIARTFGVGATRSMRFSKKCRGAIPLSETLLPYGGNHEVVLDELWTFVQSKVNTYWVWLALSRKNLQVIAFQVGDRDLRSALTFLGASALTLPRTLGLHWRLSRL
jgi:hypothetical protein